MSKNFKSGFAAILGCPNAGKSTLLNRLVGEKISIVTYKPQTTRNKIAGILTTKDYQIVFLDTPGILNAKDELSLYMQKGYETARKDTDIVVYLIDGEKPLSKKDISYLETFKKSDKLIIAVNKTDSASKETVIPILSDLNKYNDIAKLIIPVSARTGENCDILLNKIISLLDFGEQFYEADALTDKSERFIVSEIIREKILLNYQEEIPYGVSVVVNKFQSMDNGVLDIDCDIIVEKESHKKILIGKNGSALKKFATNSRADIEKFLDNKVFLTLFVKVKENWKDNVVILKDIGYDKKNI